MGTYRCSIGKWALIGCLGVIWISNYAVADESNELPSQWQSLSVGEFATTMASLYSPHEDVFSTELDEGAVRQHAARMYAQIDLASTSLSMLQANVLHGLAYPELSEASKFKDLVYLKSLPNDFRGQPYVALRARISMLTRLGATSMTGPLIKAWLDAGGGADQVWADDLLQMRESISPWIDVGQNSSVVWQGTLQAPVSGAYSFSIADLKVSGQAYRVHEVYDLKHSVVLKIDGAQVLNSTPDKFQQQSAPVQLAVGRPVAIEMVTTFETPRMPKYVGQGVLNWSGPGLGRTVIAPNHFTNLRVTYRWQQGGKDQEITQSVPNIDQGWPDGVSFGLDQEFQLAMAEAIWSRVMAADYLSQFERTKARHPFLMHSEDAVEVMTAERCSQFIRELISRPEMVRWQYPKEALDVYRSFRLKDQEGALDLFGLWARQNADCDCQMPMEYISRMRHFRKFYQFDYYYQRAWRTMAQCVSQHTPTQAKRLEEEYLELEGGGCSLPVANILAYVYMGQGRHDEWVAKLTAKIGDDGLTGDQKVNWYLAAAQAHENRLGPHGDIYAIINPRPMDAFEFLDSALLAAKDVHNRLRILRAKAARFAALRDFQSARQALEQAREMSPPERLWEVAQWQGCVDRFEEHERGLDQQQAEESAKSYLAVLKSRLDSATQRGDQNGIRHYKELITTAGGD